MRWVIVSRQKLEAEISKRAAEACERAIAEIGAELHDNLIQKLTSFRLYMPRAERSCSDEVLIVKMEVDLADLIRVARHISRKMLSVRTEGDTLMSMLQRLCRMLEGPTTSRIYFTAEGEPAPIDEYVESHIVRIVQELIQNAYKHSAAWHIWVRLRWQPGLLTIEVEDDGTGFSHIQEFIGRLKNKNNTLRIRSRTIGASIDYAQGAKGLLARFELRTIE